jgi:hypothetical protein
MKEYETGIDIRMMKGSRLSIAIEVLLVTLLVFMPFAFYNQSTESEGVVKILSGLIVCCFLLKVLLNVDQELVRAWLYVPAGLFVLIVIFRIVPLPIRVTAKISPNIAILMEKWAEQHQSTKRL